MLRLVPPPVPSTAAPSPRSAIRLPKSASFLRCSPSSQHRTLSLSRFPYLALRCSLSGVPFALTAAECSVEEDDGFDEELGILLALLPKGMRERLDAHPDRRQLVEVVMDLGRRPFARFPTGDFVLSDDPITLRDLQHATSQVGDFTADNRAGICRTLHRISAIRNRKGAIVGLTCRVGRAVSGSANMLRDLVLDGASLLLIGPPGVGKTTIIRDIARMLADDFKKRVMIVDTSNEIGGDGDIPHPGIGSARRMQVPNPDMQHKGFGWRLLGGANVASLCGAKFAAFCGIGADRGLASRIGRCGSSFCTLCYGCCGVLIETVENHMPQVIVIDEIGTRLEAMAASTIAQRGIQLVATAHGVTIENLTMNPSLEMLVGGIQSVTLGDDEASRRGVQKTVLERKGPSTFTCGVEIVSKTEMRVHRSLEATVDALLSGRTPLFEFRKMVSQALPNENPSLESERFSDIPFEQPSEVTIQEGMEKDEKVIDENNSSSMEELIEHSGETEAFIYLYVYGILETSVVQAIKQLRLDGEIKLTDNISEADAFLALHSKLKKNSRIQAAAKSHDMPIYVTKASSLLQITKALRALVAEHGNAFQDAEGEDNTSLLEKADALEEARLAIEQVVIPEGEAAELLPRSPHIISAQMDFIQGYNLKSEKVGKEPNFHLRILPSHTCTTYSELEVDHGFEESGISDDINSSYNGTFRLPFLPE